MKELPPDRLRLAEVLMKYKGFTRSALARAIERKRLEAFKVGFVLYTTDRAIKKYLATRNVSKIPKKYKKKLKP